MHTFFAEQIRLSVRIIETSDREIMLNLSTEVAGIAKSLRTYSHATLVSLACGQPAAAARKTKR